LTLHKSNCEALEPFFLSLLAVAHPREGDGPAQAFVFWISVLVILCTFYFALDGRLSEDGAIFATGTALIFGYWLSEQKQKLR